MSGQKLETGQTITQLHDDAPCSPNRCRNAAAARPGSAHELTAAEDRDTVDWAAVERSPAFGELLAAKRRFIVPATLFFVVYYFALPLAVGFLPQLMSTRVFGNLNLAYLFALSQFVMAWTLAALYVRAAARWDRMAAQTAATAPRIAGS